MTKKIEPLSNWITANYAASLLSAKIPRDTQRDESKQTMRKLTT